MSWSSGLIILGCNRGFLLGFGGVWQILAGCDWSISRVRCHHFCWVFGGGEVQLINKEGLLMCVVGSCKLACARKESILLVSTCPPLYLFNLPEDRILLGDLKRYTPIAYGWKRQKERARLLGMEPYEIMGNNSHYSQLCAEKLIIVIRKFKYQNKPHFTA